MKNAVRALLLAAVACVATITVAETPDLSEAEDLLSVGVTGSTPPERTKNPSAILESVDVQRLILEISERPASREAVEEAIEDEFFTLDDMISVGLLRQENGRYHIDFNLLRVDDQKTILETAERLGRDIARAFLSRREDLEAVAATHDQPHVSAPELLYLVVGCFSLDWDGLEVTEQGGYRAGAQRTIDGRSFTPWAKERGAEVSLKGLYWGSHNAGFGNVTLTTFGDHDALPRLGLPDMKWQMRGAFEPYEAWPEARRAASRMLSAYADDSMHDVVRVMMALRDWDLSFEEIATQTQVEEGRLRRLLEFLEAADYVEKFGERYGSTVLVLESEDADMVRELLKIGRTIIVEWHEANYETVRAELAGLTPLRNGVPFERVYTEVWHFVFAIANRTLVEEGLFADPYAESRRYKGFIPAVWAKGLSELP